MNLKSISDTDIDIRVRVAFVVTVTAVVGNTIGFLANFFLFGFAFTTYATFLCAVLAILTTWLGFRERKIGVCFWIMIYLLIFFEFPLLLLVFGPVMLPYIVMSYVAIIMVSPPGKLTLLSYLIPVYDLVVLIFTVQNPYIMGKPEQSAIIGSAVVTFLVSMSCLTVALGIWKSLYTEKTEELESLSYFDQLTGAHNRQYLAHRLVQGFGGERGCVLIMLDIDNFKSINDKYGHPYGDEVLKKLTEIISNKMRKEDVIVRLGGEEFLVVYDNVEKDIAVRRMKSIMDEFRAYGVSSRNISLALSGGAGYWEKVDASDYNRIYSILDELLYQAKHSGKNQIHWH